MSDGASTARLRVRLVDDTCLGLVDLKLDEYESLHEGAGVFVIVPAIPASTER